MKLSSNERITADLEYVGITHHQSTQRVTELVANTLATELVDGGGTLNGPYKDYKDTYSLYCVSQYTL